MIDLRKLRTGNKILLETKECVFEIEVINPENGFVNISGGKRFIIPTVATILGSYGFTEDDATERLVKELCIDKNYGVQIHYTDKEDISCDIITSVVVSAKISGDGWSYEVWENDEKKKILNQAIDEAIARNRISIAEETNEDTDL